VLNRLRELPTNSSTFAAATFCFRFASNAGPIAIRHGLLEMSENVLAIRILLELFLFGHNERSNGVTLSSLRNVDDALNYVIPVLVSHYSLKRHQTSGTFGCEKFFDQRNRFGGSGRTQHLFHDIGSKFVNSKFRQSTAHEL